MNREDELTTMQVCKLLDLSVQRIRQLRCKGILPHEAKTKLERTKFTYKKVHVEILRDYLKNKSKYSRKNYKQFLATNPYNLE